MKFDSAAVLLAGEVLENFEEVDEVGKRTCAMFRRRQDKEDDEYAYRSNR